MTMQLENDVREAMTARASTLPSGAVARLRAVDYRPRRRRAPAAAGALVGAATAGTVVAVVVGGGAPAAYAGWSPTPTSAPAPSPAAATNCQSQLTSHDGPQGGPQGPGFGSGAWQNVLTDVRGPFTVALFQDDGAYAACFTSSSFTEVSQISSGGTGNASSGSLSLHGSTSVGGSAPSPGRGATSVTVGGTSSGDLQDVVQTHLSTTADGAYTLIDGRTASGVTGVTFVRVDGQDVVATVTDGWLVAWWPGTAQATSVQVTTASGTTNEQLQSSIHSPASAPSTSGGPVDGSSSGAGDSGNTGASSGNSGNSGVASAGAGG